MWNILDTIVKEVNNVFLAAAWVTRVKCMAGQSSEFAGETISIRIACGGVIVKIHRILLA